MVVTGGEGVNGTRERNAGDRARRDDGERVRMVCCPWGQRWKDTSLFTLSTSRGTI